MTKKTFRDHHATPVTSIRAFCLQCVGFSPKEVELCTAPECPLFPYRMGKRPTNSTKIGLTEACFIADRGNISESKIIENSEENR